MRTLIIYHSEHHYNTEKIAKSMAEVLNADLKKTSTVELELLHEYDLLGFGSGIYFGRHHKDLIACVEQMPFLRKKAFIFSTSGIGGSGTLHRPLRDRLKDKHCEIIGEFSCKAFDTFGLLRLVGGTNRGRPDENDLESARAFARSLLQKT